MSYIHGKDRKKVKKNTLLSKCHTGFAEMDDSCVPVPPRAYRPPRQPCPCAPESPGAHVPSFRFLFFLFISPYKAMAEIWICQIGIIQKQHISVGEFIIKS